MSGASVRALRHYEEEGLITPGRRANGYRDYCPSTIGTVLHIRSLLKAGLPVRLIRAALPGPSDGSDGPRSSSCEEFLAEVERYRDRLAAQIASLEAQRSALDTYLGRARPPASA